MESSFRVITAARRETLVHKRISDLKKKEEEEPSADRSASLFRVQSCVKTPFGGYEKPHPNGVRHLSILLPAMAYTEHFSKWLL